jgi:3-methylcrotonyl-CoA carboxylase alpha subunit
MIARLLIANRGEIAVRVARTARRLGIHVIAVHSDADAGAMHVAVADEAVRIGPEAPSESYLNIEAIIAAARRTQADAIHPGYGFLSENADFADACAAAGITLVGPSAASMRAMGDKAASKAVMEAAGVPLLPGYHGDDQAPELLAEKAAEIGFPVLIKASAGGGGRGMRIVENAEAFADALASAQREAKGAFGDDRVLIEKYLTVPRHIEVQVFGDGRGNAVHLFERDCSLQRRYQKVIEEAPAPGMSAARRAEIGAAAVAAATAIDYAGAGTVEFIVDASEAGADGPFYFMEMNTRLQVEHPVTECITGLDLVAWQLDVANGEPLPAAQEEIAINGHAIEARLYAEDPDRDFLPSPGRVIAFEAPDGAGMRVDTGVRSGDDIAVAYDPMIAKVIAHGADRAAAIETLDRALAQLVCAGPTTNQAFLRRAVRHPAFAAGEIDTGFIARHADALTGGNTAGFGAALVAAAKHVLDTRAGSARNEALRRGEANSPWAATDGWRANLAVRERLRFTRDGEDLFVDVSRDGDGARFALPEGMSGAAGQTGDWQVFSDGGTVVAVAGGTQHRFERYDPVANATGRAGGGGQMTAPMPGRIVRVAVAPGDRVNAGQVLVVLEAMKMEHSVTAHADGVVAELFHGEGDQVAEGTELLRIESGEE